MISYTSQLQLRLQAKTHNLHAQLYQDRHPKVSFPCGVQHLKHFLHPECILRHAFQILLLSEFEGKCVLGVY